MTARRGPWVAIIPVAIVVALIVIGVTGFALVHNSRPPADHRSDAVKFCTIFRVKPSEQIDLLRHPAVPNDPGYTKFAAGAAKAGVLAYVPADHRAAARLYVGLVDAVSAHPTLTLTPQQQAAVNELDGYVAGGCRP